MKKKIIITFLSMGMILTTAFTSQAFDSVKRGDKGEPVVQIQQALINLGYLSGTADGAFGPGTEAAVSEFQADNELDVTGMVGEATFNKLIEMSGSAAAETQKPDVQTADAQTPDLLTSASDENTDENDESILENIITGNTFTDGEFVYEELENGNLRIVEYQGNDEMVTISSKANDKNITEIGNGVFADNNEIEDFIIWADLEYIGNGAFKDCTNLESFSIGAKVKELGKDCFAGCSSLEDVIIWADLEVFPENCFKDCVGLKEISISSKNKLIGKSAFENCSSLKEVILWGGEKIGEAAFRNCTSLEEISIPSEMKYIGTAAFKDCTNLKDVTIWNKDSTEIVENAFDGCPFQPTGCKLVPVPEEYHGDKEIKTADTNQDGNENGNDTNQASAEDVPSGIRPEIKEAIDSYEAFFDEYIRFMESYDDSDISMISSYISYMTQYTDTMKKLEAIGDKDLSSEENEYYLEVSLRIEQKLLTAAVNME